MLNPDSETRDNGAFPGKRTVGCIVEYYARPSTVGDCASCSNLKAENTELKAENRELKQDLAEAKAKDVVQQKTIKKLLKQRSVEGEMMISLGWKLKSQVSKISFTRSIYCLI